MLLPALGKAKAKAQATACKSNLKQLQLAWQLYTDDNNDVMPLNKIDATSTRSLPGSWALGNSSLDVNVTNLQAGTIFPYYPSVTAYRCPSDLTKASGVGGQRFRPFAAMPSSAPSTRSADITRPPSCRRRISMRWRSCRHFTSQGHTRIWVFIEPNEASHGHGGWDFYITQNDYWGHLPTDRHAQGCNLSFVDGHADFYRWKASQRETSSNTSRPNLAGRRPGRFQPIDRRLSPAVNPTVDSVSTRQGSFNNTSQLTSDSFPVKK
jgi:prepilin-type processing-associated H-X9-DG protein